MRRVFLVSALFVGSLAVGVVEGQGPKAVSTYLYDDFRSGVINPAKWEGTGGVTSNTLEFVREIKNEHLRLGAKTYGDRWGDTGSVFDYAELDLKNAQDITSFGARVAVTSISSLSCTNNPWVSDPEVQLIGGGFFTIGDPGSGTGNVDAYVKIQEDAPGGALAVRLAVVLTGASEIGGADLGTVAIGEPVFLFVRWDRANHRFVGGMQKMGMPTVTATVPYALDDSRAADYTYRGLSVRNNTANCAATPTFSGAEAEFDGVMVNVPWKP
ncbi:MAG TPA: hypothetical protein VMK12_18135 [Anaeromyxobacteraceae bacterium]|nr:hypothetical protein [Anaeromyxobacteraceae bacterium]